MTLTEFNNLSNSEKANTFFEEGVLIAERLDSQYKVLLFKMNGFYVEVFYHSKQNIFMGLRTFKNIDVLNPYINSLKSSFE